MRTSAAERLPAGRRQAATSGRKSGRGRTVVPGRRMMYSERPPEGRLSCLAWPYLKSDSHFWGRPRRQRRQWPQEFAQPEGREGELGEAQREARAVKEGGGVTHRG